MQGWYWSLDDTGEDEHDKNDDVIIWVIPCKNDKAMKDTKAGNDEVEEFVWVLEVLKSVLG